MISAAADKKAAEHEKASSASAASTKELELLRANAKRFEGMLKEAERQLQAQVEKAQATAEAEKAQASSGLDAKVRVMEDIIHDQQSELSGSHRFAAVCKLSGALEKRLTATLSSFFGAWHRYYLILAGTEQAKAFASATEAKGASEVAELRAELGGRLLEAMRRMEDMKVEATKAAAALRDANTAQQAAVADGRAAVAAAQAQAEAAIASNQAELDKALAAVKEAEAEKERAVAAARAEVEAESDVLAGISATLTNGASTEAAASSALLQPKLDAMARMVREQQAELSEGYRFMAMCKLSAALAQRRALALSGCMAKWRRALMVPATLGASKDNEARAVRQWNARPPQAPSAPGAGGKKEPVSASPGAPPPGAPPSGGGGGTSTTTPSMPLARTGRSSSPLARELVEATPRRRSPSPPPASQAQLQEALAKRASKER